MQSLGEVPVQSQMRFRKIPLQIFGEGSGRLQSLREVSEGPDRTVMKRHRRTVKLLGIAPEFILKGDHSIPWRLWSFHVVSCVFSHLV